MKPFFTHTGSLIGTPEYMSPEQAMTSGLDVDSGSAVLAGGKVNADAGSIFNGTLEIRSGTATVAFSGNGTIRKTQSTKATLGVLSPTFDGPIPVNNAVAKRPRRQPFQKLQSEDSGGVSPTRLPKAGSSDVERRAS